MRLEFPNGEHAELRFSSGELRIGSAPDNEIVLSAPGVEPYHAVLTVDARGPILWLLSEQGGAFVNARPVRERALLRLGDRVTIGRAAFVLKPESDERFACDSAWELDPSGIEMQRGGPPRMVLRAVSGRASGQVVPVPGRLVAGSDASCELRLEDRRAPARAFALSTDGRHALLEVLSEEAVVEVNGVPVSRAFVVNGDQIACGRQRFLVEAPGLSSRPKSTEPDTASTAVLSKAAAKQAEESQEPQAAGSPWLMLAVAFLVAVAIAFLLLVP